MARLNIEQEIQKLHQDGYKVYIRHDRSRNKNGQLRPGGTTNVAIVKQIDNGDNDTTEITVATGKAKCRRNEKFRGRLGVEIALNRALQVLNGEAERRRQKKVKPILFSGGH